MRKMAWPYGFGFCPDFFWLVSPAKFLSEQLSEWLYPVNWRSGVDWRHVLFFFEVMDCGEKQELFLNTYFFKRRFWGVLRENKKNVFFCFF